MREWPTVVLREVCKQDRRQVRPNYTDVPDLPFVGLEQVASGTGEISLQAGSRTGEGKSTSFRFDNRHVLYGKLRPYLNKVALPDFEGRCSTELVPLLPSSEVDRGYLASFLKRQQTIDAVMAANTGSRMPRADMGVLLSLPIPLPSLPEQRRIVDILNRADGIRRLRREGQEKARQLIPALFIEMFGDPMSNPKGWSVVSVGDLLSACDYGTSKKASTEQTGTPVLRMGNVTTDGSLALDHLKYVDLENGERAKYRLEVGDLLFNRTNSKELVGKTGIWDGRFDAVAASYFIRLRVDPSKANPWFLWAFFNTRFMKRRLFDTARGAIGQSNINAKEVKSFPVPLPPLDLQHAFAEWVADIQAAIAQQDRMAEASEDLMASLMAQAFDGRL